VNDSVWNGVEKILIEGNCSTLRKTSPDAPLSNKNSIRTGMGSHLSLLFEELVTNNLRHGMAFGDGGSICVQNVVGSLQHYVVSISEHGLPCVNERNASDCLL
jgi:two-component sensor histidine kinase